MMVLLGNVVMGENVSALVSSRKSAVDAVCRPH